VRRQIAVSLPLAVYHWRIIHWCRFERHPLTIEICAEEPSQKPSFPFANASKALFRFA
jgi:hypothetical protein